MRRGTRAESVKDIWLGQDLTQECGSVPPNMCEPRGSVDECAAAAACILLTPQRGGVSHAGRKALSARCRCKAPRTTAVLPLWVVHEDIGPAERGVRIWNQAWEKVGFVIISVLATARVMI